MTKFDQATCRMHAKWTDSFDNIFQHSKKTKISDELELKSVDGDSILVRLLSTENNDYGGRFQENGLSGKILK